MKVRRVSFAFVSAAFLAALATTCGTAYANPASENAALAAEAYSMLNSGDAAGSIPKFTAAIESRALEPEVLANALLNRALAYQSRGEHQLAIDDYTAALALDAMSNTLRATALYNRGVSQQKLNRLPMAVEDFTGSLLLNPQFAQAFYSRGNALRDSGQLLFALSDYERALRYNHPDAARVYLGSATTYLALRRPQDARKALETALKIKPDFEQARAQLAKLGDEHASLSVAESDPLMTGSVSALVGGTEATKPDLPAAVEPPEALMAKTKKIRDRVPQAEAAATEIITASITKPKKAATEEVVAIEMVPEIPAPASAEEKIAATEAPSTAEEEGAQEPATSSAAWVVQVASANSEAAAWSTWKKLQARHKKLKGETPQVVRADLGAKGIFYRVRLGYDSQADAKAKCSKLKASGISCFVSKG